MGDKYLGDCDAYRKDHLMSYTDCPCCSSCHSDEDDGHPSLSEMKVFGGWYEVCCRIKEWREEGIRQWGLLSPEEKLGVVGNALAETEADDDC